MAKKRLKRNKQRTMKVRLRGGKKPMNKEQKAIQKKLVQSQREETQKAQEEKN